MLKIGDFAKLFNVTIKTIRFYEEKGLLKPSFVDVYSGYRYYDEKNIEDMKKILALKDLGLELSEIKNINDDLIQNKIIEYKKNIAKLSENIDILSNLSIEKGGLIDLKTFMNDEKVIGKWNLVGVYNNKEDYPTNKSELTDYKIEELYLMPNGEQYWVISWTKGYIYINNIRNPYYIEDNKMFVNIISPINENDSFVAVYEKEDDNIYTKESIRIKDDINITYIKDEEVIGTWKSIGVINNIEEIDNIDKEIDPFLLKIIFDENGELIIKYTNGLKNSNYTKNNIVNLCCKDTLSKYIIKEIDNKKYLIVEWKSNDYIYGKMINCYYVLEKE